VDENKNGYLIIIGGGEDRTGRSEVLGQASLLLEQSGVLTVLTTATENPRSAGEKYRETFKALGIKNIQILNINTREDANKESYCEKIRNSNAIFMTGGDQLRITSILGGTTACDLIKAVYFSGGLIMGTSAGASAMSSTMIVQGNDNEPARKCTLKMAPGLGLIGGVIIDQHFDQRGRFGRLICGVAENPDVLGIGIDEDTSVKVYPDLHFEVIGSNSVTIIDGRSIEASNVTELRQNELLSIVGARVHVLPQGFGYDLNTRKVLRLNEKQPDNDL
jgi:cyanophycinase